MAPDPCNDLRLEMDLKAEFLVLGLELESGAECPLQPSPLALSGAREGVSRCGRARYELPLGVVGHGSVGVTRPIVITRRDRRGRLDVESPRPVSASFSRFESSPILEWSCLICASCACWSPRAGQPASCSIPPSPGAWPRAAPRSSSCCGIGPGGQAQEEEVPGPAARQLVPAHRPDVVRMTLNQAMRSRLITSRLLPMSRRPFEPGQAGCVDYADYLVIRPTGSCT